MRREKVNVAAEFSKDRGGAGQKEVLNMVVIGHVDSGKSTLMGHLLFLLGSVSQKVMHKHEKESKKIGKQSFMYAWVLGKATADCLHC
jgi:elongation factor 1 alpha-like protein